MDIFRLLQLAKARSASDLHLVASSPPLLRVHGQLEPVTDTTPLTPEDMEQAFHQLTSDKQRTDFHRSLELDFGRDIPDVGRVRCNAARQRGTISLVIRLLPPVIPSLDELGVPEVCRELVCKGV